SERRRQGALRPHVERFGSGRRPYMDRDRRKLSTKGRQRRRSRSAAPLSGWVESDYARNDNLAHACCSVDHRLDAVVSRDSSAGLRVILGAVLALRLLLEDLPPEPGALLASVRPPASGLYPLRLDLLRIHRFTLGRPEAEHEMAPRFARRHGGRI